MVERETTGSKLMIDAKSKTVLNFRKPKEATVKPTDISEEVFFRVMRDIQGLDIIMSLQNLDCYTLPNRSFFRTINFIELLQKLARRKTMFEEAVMQRKFKKIFGLYGYKILHLCFMMSFDEHVPENSYWENTSDIHHHNL
jgi:hypothetical protein